MKVAVFILLAGFALWTIPAGAEDQAYTAQVTIVHYDESQVDNQYNFMAAVPLAVTHSSSAVYSSLLISDKNELSNRYIAEDWKTYLDNGGGTQLLNFVGDVSTGVRTRATTFFVPQRTASYAATPIEVANQIALGNWTTSVTAVIAPYVTNPAKHDLESMANGAVIASLNGAPMFFSDPLALSPATLSALGSLGVTSVVLVEIDDQLSANVNSQLQAAGIAIEADLTTESAVVLAVRSLSGHSTLCTYRSAWQHLPAALAGARYGGYVLYLDDSVPPLAEDFNQILAPKKVQVQKLAQAVPANEVESKAGQATADAFYSWLSTVHGEDPSQLETVITSEVQNGGMAVSFERALVGDPEEPLNRGAITGRLPGSPAQNIAYLNRGILYPAVIFASPRPLSVTHCFAAYEAGYPGSRYGHFTDNDNVYHIVNELRGCYVGGYSDPGVAETFNSRGYDVSFHDSPNAGTGTDPLTGDPLIGFIADLRDASSFFYDSSHGSADAFYPMNTDDGESHDVAWGTPHWPATDGEVNHSGSAYSSADYASDFTKMYSVISAYNACDCADGDIQETTMNHGALAAVSAYVSVSFNGSGWYWCTFADRLASGASLGEALGWGCAATSDIYPQHETGRDGTIMYVVFGDPNVKLVQPTWTYPSPLPPHH